MNAAPTADLVVRAARVQAMDPAAGPVTTLAIRDGKVAAAAGELMAGVYAGRPDRARS